jgi:mannonate dehydratase
MREGLRVAVGQVFDLSREVGTFATQLGAPGVHVWPQRSGSPDWWTFEDLQAVQQRCADYGVDLEAITMHRYIRAKLGLPGRDEQIEACIQTITNMGRAGVRLIGYDWEPIGFWRTRWNNILRRGAVADGFDMAVIDAHDAVLGNRVFGVGRDPGLLHPEDRSLPPDAVEALELPEGRVVSEDEMWENYRYFLRAVLPVAEQHGVTMAVHPSDPPVPMLGGVARILRSPDSFRKAMELANSPAWAIILCLGTASEMEGAAATVNEMIDAFGPIGRIGYVHFRDVQGSVPRFRECFLGDGNYDPVQVMHRLRRVGYQGFVMEDHVPVLAGDTPWQTSSRSHVIGYLQALIRATQP